MIFIVAKFKVKPDYADGWMEHVREFTSSTRAEPGNLWFDWSRSVEDPNEYVLLEAFQDGAAEAHVTSGHFRKAQKDLPPLLQETPRVRNMQMDRDEWDELGEMAVRR
ncbi:MAG: antibiotic biosynthesis monooxygenase [Tomitella sp.]|nr:antibiotic biosynthesis monooxygenase [Tomitella sp.]